MAQDSTGQAGVLLLQSGQPRFEHVEHALDKLADLRERWNNRLTIKNLSLAERYLKFELVVVACWSGPFLGGFKQYRAVLKREHPVRRPDREGDAGDILQPFLVRKRFPHVHSKMESLVSGPYRYDRLVFIEDVELVEAPEGFIPTLVWFQVLDELPRLGAGPLYCFAKSGFKFLPIFPDNELGVVVTDPARVAVPHNGDDEKIESGSGVVDCIANDAAPFGGDTFPYADFVMKLAGARIGLGKDLIRIASEEGRNLIGEFSDVAFGPFDL